MKKLGTIPLHLVPYFNLHFHTPIPNIPKKIMTCVLYHFFEMNVGLLDTQCLVSTYNYQFTSIKYKQNVKQLADLMLVICKKQREKTF